MTRVKVSGIRSGADAATALRAGADILACVFYPGSPRYVTLEQAWDVRQAVPPDVPLVGIFVDAPTPLIERIRSHCGLTHVQLFGAETRAHVDALPTAFKAVSVETQEEVGEAARTFLHRRRREPPAMLLHLSGPLTTRWDAAAEATSHGAVLLASPALAPDTLAAALAASSPWGVDVWEQVEAEPGRLDPGRLRAFLSAAREAAPTPPDQEEE